MSLFSLFLSSKLISGTSRNNGVSSGNKDEREAERRGLASTHVEGCHLCKRDDKGFANSCYRVNLEEEDKEEEG